MAVGAFYLPTLFLAVIFAQNMGWLQDQFEISSGAMFEKSFFHGTGFLILTFSFFFGYVCFLTLWISMWVYWARQKSILWFFLLLFGVMLGSHLFYYYFVYSRGWEKYLRIQNSINEEKQKMVNS